MRQKKIEIGWIYIIFETKHVGNEGSEFWLAVPPNIVAGDIYRNEFVPLFYVTTNEDTPVPFIVRFRLTGTPTTHMVTKGEIVKIEVPSDLKINYQNLRGQGNDMSILINATDAVSYTHLTLPTNREV